MTTHDRGSILVGLVVLACAGERSPDPAQTQPQIVFAVLSAVPEPGHARARQDTVWSSNDDLDSIYVILKGLPSGGPIQVTVTAEVRRVSLEDEAQGVVPPASSPTLVEVFTRDITDVGALPSFEPGRLLAVLRPSFLFGDWSRQHVEAGQSVVGLIIKAKIGANPVDAHLMLLPPI
jgi:hypothetical protein